LEGREKKAKFRGKEREIAYGEHSLAKKIAEHGLMRLAFPASGILPLGKFRTRTKISNPEFELQTLTLPN
jgi:hypothetical protein